MLTIVSGSLRFKSSSLKNGGSCLRMFYSPTTGSGSLSRAGKAVFLIACCWLSTPCSDHLTSPSQYSLWSTEHLKRQKMHTHSPLLQSSIPFYPRSFLSPSALLIHKTTGWRIALVGVIDKNGFCRAWDIYDDIAFFLMPYPSFSWCLDAMGSNIRM